MPNNSMGLIPRLQRAARAFTRQPVDISMTSKQLDAMIHNKEIETGSLSENKQADTEANMPMSNLDIHHTDRNLAYIYMYNALGSFVQAMDTAPDSANPIAPRRREDPVRDWFMAEFWKNEPIMAGAVYSLTAKYMSLGWAITGHRRAVINTSKILARAASMEGYDWGAFIAATSQDFLTTNRGTFWETPRQEPMQPLVSDLVDLGHMDALCCTLTGNSLAPVIYNSVETGQTLVFHPGEYVHFASLGSARERFLGIGICAVDRAYRAARMLIGLHNYDEEKLNNLPPEGICTVTGLTMDEFRDAVAMYKNQRDADESLTFPQVLWLVGSQPNVDVKVTMNGFRTIPESFDRKTVIEQYVNTVALCFGVDSQEFWTAMSGQGLNSGSSAHLAHNKAKSKGPGEFTSFVERHINGIIDPDSDFHFHSMDQEESANEAAVAKAWVDAYMPLYNMMPVKGNMTGGGGPQQMDMYSREKANFNPKHPDGSPTLPVTPQDRPDTGGDMGINEGGQSKPMAEQVITKDQILELLAQKGIIPDYMVHGERIVQESDNVHNYYFKSDGDPDEFTEVYWDHGVLKERRLAPITLNTQSVNSNVPVAEHLRQTDPMLKELITELRIIREAGNDGQQS